MKKRLLQLVLTILLVGFTCTSCFTTMALLSTIPKSGKAFSLTGRSKLELKIVQTLGKGEALAITENYDVVKIESLTELYYDGKRLYGYFTLLDTYTYKTTQGIWKTVPVYVRSREYRKNKEIWDRIHLEDDIDDNCDISINSFYL